jgi:putative membrane protein
VIRLLVRTAIALLANAIALIVAAALLDDMTLSASGFVIAVVIFTVVFALMQPFLASQLRRAGSAVLGGVSLIATLIALIVTDLVSDGLNITGAVTWIAATVIVWLGAVIATFVLPFLGLEKLLEQRQS